MQDSELIELYWVRDERAIAETSASYGAYCRTIAGRILRDGRDAEECVNDTWLRAWNAIPPHRPVSLPAFLAKITRSLALNRWNRDAAQKRGGGEVALSLEELKECIPASADPQEAVEAAQLEEDIRRFLRTLPERERSIFLSRYFYVETPGEIAKRRHLSENNVSVILSRTRKKLRLFLVKEGYFT